MKILHDELMRDHVNKIVFDVLGREKGYLVGGFLRDAIMNRPSADRDYVVSGEMGHIVDRVAAITAGRSFSLGRFGLMRIIRPDASTLDFSPLRTALMEDLMARDFAMNALAWSPHEGLTDPLGGVGDIQNRVVRAISDWSLARDPVRIVRAFRFSQELGFSIDKRTLILIGQYAGLMDRAARERITHEFIRMLSGGDPSGILDLMNDQQVIGRLIYFNNDKLERKIKAISNFQQIFNVLPVKYNLMLREELSPGLSRLAFTRLAILLVGCREHSLCLSSAILGRLRKIERATGLYNPDMSQGSLYDLFDISAEGTLEFLLIHGRFDLISEYERFLQVQWDPLLSVEEIKSITGLEPGRKLGSLIRGLKREQFKGCLLGIEEARNACIELNLG